MNLIVQSRTPVSQSFYFSGKRGIVWPVPVPVCAMWYLTLYLCGLQGQPAKRASFPCDAYFYPLFGNENART